MAARDLEWRPACWVASCSQSGALEIIPDRAGIGADVAEQDGCRVVFEGVLFEDAMNARVRSGLRDRSSNAGIVLRRYLESGLAALGEMPGIFAVVLSDLRTGEVFAARDPLGIYPLFYADTGSCLEFSISIDALLARPSVSNAINRLALADHLSHRWPEIRETYFEAVWRVPPGNLVRWRGGASVAMERYWDPSPLDRPVDWIAEDDLGRFDELLEQAVRRRLEFGRVGIYLSGGLDSVTIAALAADESRDLGIGPPEGLSLVFEHEAANEEELQRDVGVALSLPHTLVPLSEAVGKPGLLRSALEVSAQRPAPLLSLWEPAYERLANLGREHGLAAILTGSGGDEWLEFSPVYAADLIRIGDLRSLIRVWEMMHRSYRLSRLTAARHVVWTFGLQPIARQLGARTLDRLAPSARVALRRRRIDSSTPSWVAPDPDLRNQLLRRHQRMVEENRPGSHYMRQVRRALDSPIVTAELEETFERGRLLGIPILHPFLDADLASFLYVTPPKLLMRGGRSKGLIRSYLSRRFPELGFERQRKLNANAFFIETLVAEGKAIWQELGGARALASLGVVDARELDAVMEQLLSGSEPRSAFRIWYVLSLEVWTRARLDFESPFAGMPSE